MKGFGRVSVASTASALAVCLAGSASADQPAASEVTLKVAGGPPFHGRVLSESPACRGKWVFSSQLQGATVVRAKVARSKSSGVVCRSALSPAKRVR